MRVVVLLLMFFSLTIVAAAQDDAPDLNGFPLPALEVITRDNLDRIEYLARIGNGLARDIAFNNSDVVYVASTIGVFQVARLGDPLPIELTPIPMVKLAIHRDGTLLAAGGDDGSIRLYDLTQGALIPSILEAHLYTISILEFYGSDDSKLVSADISGVMRTWDVEGETAVETSVTAYDESIQRVLITQNELTPVFGERITEVEFPRFWLSTKSVAWTTLTYIDEVIDPLLSTADSSSLSFGADGTTTLERDGQVIVRFFGHRRAVTSAVLNLDETVLFSGSLDMTINVYDATITGEAGALLTLTGHNGGIVELAMNSDGTLLASSGYDGTIRLWGVRAG